MDGGEQEGEGNIHGLENESRETVKNIYCWRMKTRSGKWGEQKLMRPKLEAGWQEVIWESKLSESFILSQALNQL